MTRIGLEIHCQLTSLNSKLFCPCRADYRGRDANTNVCPVCLGMPGTLPRLNGMAVQKSIAIAEALGCTTPKRIAFFRKNYFYPDLPKNFQITQINAYGDTSIGTGGSVEAAGRRIGIRRVQLEEDPGRLVYEGASERTQITLVDYNRAGTPLVEVVTEPDFEDPRQVRAFLNMLSDLLENLGVSDPGLEGAMRADGNVSVGDGPKVEIKNINSFHDLEKALEYELVRQNSLGSRGIAIPQETRHWDDRRRVTVSARGKEEDMDYRYFPEADIPWVLIDGGTLERIRKGMPESISSKKSRYVSEYGISPQVADVLSADRFFSDLFEGARGAAIGGDDNDGDAKEIANMITTDVMGLLDTRERRAASRLAPAHLSELAACIRENRISRNSARGALGEMIKTGESAGDVIKRLDLGMVSDSADLEGLVDTVISEEAKAVAEAGSNPQAVNYLVGRVMRRSGGRADPKAALALLRKRLPGR